MYFILLQITHKIILILLQEKIVLHVVVTVLVVKLKSVEFAFFVKDMKKNGGPGRKKKGCIHRKCSGIVIETPKEEKPSKESGIVCSFYFNQ